MFGIRSPPANDKTERAGPSKVRTSIGEIEARAMTSPEPTTSQAKIRQTAMTVRVSPKQPKTHRTRTAEAKACLTKAKIQLGLSRNLKTNIKEDVESAIERLYALVKEAEEERLKAAQANEKGKAREDPAPAVTPVHRTYPGKEARMREELAKQIEEHGTLLREHKEEMERLREQLCNQRETGKDTYASIVSRSPKRQPIRQTAMHSVVVTSCDDQETGEQVLERVKSAINAKEEGVRIDRVRQARDRKVIVGCRNAEEIRKVKEKIRETGGKLSAEDIKNKDPLVIFYGVLKSLSDEDIVKGLKNQNKNLFGGAAGGDANIEVRYRRRTRNPHIEHVVARVSPPVWQRMMEAGAVHIDIQRVRVADQSPLVQCSRCLGYGHGKRVCSEGVDVCSHCGGSHLRSQCADYLAGATPSCVNCKKAKMDGTHNAFSDECPVRRKWEAIARATVAYC